MEDKLDQKNKSNQINQSQLVDSGCLTKHIIFIPDLPVWMTETLFKQRDISKFI